MDYINLAILLVAIFIAGVAIRKSNGKHFKLAVLETLLTVSNDKIMDLPKIIAYLSDIFSPAVIDVYLDILRNPKEWFFDGGLLTRSSDGLQIWGYNSMHDREFWYGGADKAMKEVTAEKNKALSWCDRMLLDKIIKQVKIRQDCLVTKVFL